jgi:hypothetical protein
VVEDASVTVTSTPVAVLKVKPDADVASTMPVAPPADGSATGPPPAGTLAVAVGVAASAVDDPDDETAIADVLVSPATAHVSPAATISPPFFFESSRRTPLDRGGPGRRVVCRVVVIHSGSSSLDQLITRSTALSLLPVDTRMLCAT